MPEVNLKLSFFDKLFKISGGAVFDLLEDAVEGGKAFEAGAHSDLSNGEIGFEQENFRSFSTSCVDILEIGH